jgi:hypothetical protein
VVEAVDERLVLGALARDVEADRLDGQRALDERVERLVDGAHGAESDAFRDLVAPDRLGHAVGGATVLAHFPADPMVRGLDVTLRSLQPPGPDLRL